MGNIPRDIATKATRVVAFDPQGNKVFERPVVGVRDQLLVDVGWGFLPIEHFIAEIKRNNVWMADAYPPYPRDERYVHRYFYYDDDRHEYRYYYDDDRYEYRYHHH